MSNIHGTPPLKRSHYTVPLDEEKRIINELRTRQDPESQRLLRYLGLLDLTQTPDSPIYEIVEMVKKMPPFTNFDIITIPEIVSAKVSFDLFNFPPDHPARNKSDTYYVNGQHLLRTHDTVMWYYYLTDPRVQDKIKNNQPLGVLCYGKVYRKDEIDRRHMNVFHQLGGLYLVSDSRATLGLDDLKKALTDITQHLFGRAVNFRFTPETFPYTDPSLEIEVKKNDQWIEILGGGLPRKDVLANFNVKDYNGWAFGFGLERLAILSLDLPDIRLLWSADPRVKRQLNLGQKYQPVSKYPPITRDISFIVSKNFVPNDYFDLIRDLGGDLIEEVSLLDTYENADKFGSGKKSYTYRIIYRSNERTLTNAEVNARHEKLRARTEREFSAQLR